MKNHPAWGQQARHLPLRGTKAKENYHAREGGNPVGATGRSPVLRRLHRFTPSGHEGFGVIPRSQIIFFGFFICVICGLILSFRPLEKAFAYSPSAEERCYEVILPNGLIETGYDQDADSKADWITVHRTGRDQEPMPHALFYALDPDGDGLWEQVWIDQAEDGWNGNEVVYETNIPLNHGIRDGSP